VTPQHQSSITQEELVVELAILSSHLGSSSITQVVTVKVCAVGDPGRSVLLGVYMCGAVRGQHKPSHVIVVGHIHAVAVADVRPASDVPHTDDRMYGGNWGVHTQATHSLIKHCQHTALPMVKTAEAFFKVSASFPFSHGVRRDDGMRIDGGNMPTCLLSYE